MQKEILIVEKKKLKTKRFEVLQVDSRAQLVYLYLKNYEAGCM